jgi:UDPglucose--hexose-1-phosphate uridylyltransferase
VTWEQRWHPLREEWVIIAAHRDDRPWSGQSIVSAQKPVPAYVADCCLGPGNQWVSGVRNEADDGVFAFDNDLPCVGTAAPRPAEPPSGLYRAERASGLARGGCFVTDSAAEAKAAEHLAVPSVHYRQAGA